MISPASHRPRPDRRAHVVRDLLDRADLSRSPAAVPAARHALELYSCLAAPVFNFADAFGLTVTGGLPFFGGPGNDYAMHVIASTVALVRAEPGSHGFAANGGLMSKSTTPSRLPGRHRVRRWNLRGSGGGWPYKKGEVGGEHPRPAGHRQGRRSNGELGGTVHGAVRAALRRR
jgi:hypothetical protein